MDQIRLLPDLAGLSTPHSMLHESHYRTTAKKSTNQSEETQYILQNSTIETIMPPDAWSTIHSTPMSMPASSPRPGNYQNRPWKTPPIDSLFSHRNSDFEPMQFEDSLPFSEDPDSTGYNMRPRIINHFTTSSWNNGTNHPHPTWPPTVGVDYDDNISGSSTSSCESSEIFISSWSSSHRGVASGRPEELVTSPEQAHCYPGCSSPSLPEPEEWDPRPRHSNHSTNHHSSSQTRSPSIMKSPSQWSLGVESPFKVEQQNHCSPDMQTTLWDVVQGHLFGGGDPWFLICKRLGLDVSSTSQYQDFFSSDNRHGVGYITPSKRRLYSDNTLDLRRTTSPMDSSFQRPSLSPALEKRSLVEAQSDHSYSEHQVDVSDIITVDTHTITPQISNPESAILKESEKQFTVGFPPFNISSTREYTPSPIDTLMHRMTEAISVQPYVSTPCHALHDDNLRAPRPDQSCDHFDGPDYPKENLAAAQTKEPQIRTLLPDLPVDCAKQGHLAELPDLEGPRIFSDEYEEDSV
ncbi:hypothetical protein C8Q75DRAFT_404476 [Abortiporus biennis]|nr:hypothetical protein C8Q75DRAFT_404476 [Abortiporus biennis]